MESESVTQNEHHDLALTRFRNYAHNLGSNFYDGEKKCVINRFTEEDKIEWRNTNCNHTIL
jgi:hypothetical protein